MMMLSVQAQMWRQAQDCRVDIRVYDWYKNGLLLNLTTHWPYFMETLAVSPSVYKVWRMIRKCMNIDSLKTGEKK